MQTRNFDASFSRTLSLVALLLAFCGLAHPASAANGKLPRTTMSHLAYSAAISGTRNGLPPTTMDSFVRNAASRADAIYGDEGVGAAPPPFYGGFTKEHRINAGITGEQDAGLTTGHSERLPDAWGRDEFLGQEWTQSGSNGGAYDLAASPNLPGVSPTMPAPAPPYKGPIGKMAYPSATKNGATYRTFSSVNSVQAISNDSGF